MHTKKNKSKSLFLKWWIWAIIIVAILIGANNSSDPTALETDKKTSVEHFAKIDSPTQTSELVEDTKPTNNIDVLTSSENSTFSIHFIDVGQADAALVECDGHYMLIDGGNKEDSNIIYSVLKNAGVDHLDMIVGTHAHEDHIGGIPGALNYTDADLTLCPVKSYDSNAFDDFKKYADLNGGGIVVPSVGDIYYLGSASVEIIGVNSESDTNNTSIVLMITYGDTRFLFTGDAEREAEQAILASGFDITADVLKVGHHGSNTSTTYPFLREIMPTYAIISVGRENNYGHPDEDTLSRLRDADVEVYETDLNGDIKCVSDGKTVSLSVSKTINEPSSMIIAEPTPYETPSQEPDSQQETTVWVSSSGKKYHSTPSCSNMKSPTELTETEAKNRGYDPCKKCW